MPTANPNPDLNTSHYMRGPGGGEAIKRAGLSSWPDASNPQPATEITMLRIRTTAAILVLSLSSALSAQAGTPLETQIHNAAVTACMPETAQGMTPRAHYGAIADQCVYRVSRSAMTRHQALAGAKTDDRAKLVHN